MLPAAGGLPLLDNRGAEFTPDPCTGFLHALSVSVSSGKTGCGAAIQKYGHPRTIPSTSSIVPRRAIPFQMMTPNRDKPDVAVADGSSAGDSGSTELPLWKLAVSSTKLRACSPLLKKVVGEVIGTFFLMFFLCGVSMGDYKSKAGINIVGHAIAAGFSIMIIIFSLGNISGAHVNPSVTLAFASVGQFPWIQVPWYVVGQLLGSILGTLAARVLYDVHVDLALTLPAVGEFRAFLMEYIVGVEFMFLASAMSTDARVTGLHASIALAVTIALNIMVSGPLSGASMNPVRSLAPAIVVGKYCHIWVYIVAPPLGTVSGALAYKFLTRQPLRT